MAVSVYIPGMGESFKRPAVSVHGAVVAVPRNVALLGFGTVGRAVAEILCRTPQPHLRLTHIFNRDASRKRVPWVPSDIRWTDSFSDVLSSNADVVVELIGGIQPAYAFIRQALLSGKSVVTANKHVIAKHGPELHELARRAGQHLQYGASVGGAVPVLAALQHGLRGDRLIRACGILNGTCNYILSDMETKGTTFAAAVAQAQKLGYAEKDPSDDIHGLDAACKLAIVVRVGFQAELNAFDIARQSIDGVQPVDFRYARQLGCTIRQISCAELTGGGLHNSVGPALLPLSSPLAHTVDNQNAIVFTGEKSGDTLLVGRGAGGDPTAVAVVSDLLALSQLATSSGATSILSRYGRGQVQQAHYLRVTAKTDGIGEAVLRVLCDHGIAVLKKLEPPARKTRAFALRKCRPAALQKALAQIAELGGLSECPLCLPLFK